MSARGIVGSLLIATLMSAASEAKADALPIRLEYFAPDACPNESAVLAAIRARASHVRFAAADGPARTLRLRVDGEPPSFHAQLEITELHGPTMVREMGAPTCEAVVSAMALVAAISIDPLADAASADPPPARAEASIAPALPAPPPPPPLPPPMPPRLSPVRAHHPSSWRRR